MGVHDAAQRVGVGQEGPLYGYRPRVSFGQEYV